MSRGKLNFSQKTISRIIRKSRFARIRQAPITTRRTQSPGNLDRSALHISASPWNVPVNSDTAWNRKKSKRGMKNFRTVLSGTSKGVFGHKNGTREMRGLRYRFLPQNGLQPLTVQWKTIVLTCSCAKHLELSKRHFLAHFHLQTAQNGTVEKCGTPTPILKSNNWFTITLHVCHCKPVFKIFFWNNVKYHWHSLWSVIV